MPSVPALRKTHFEVVEADVAMKPTIQVLHSRQNHFLISTSNTVALHCHHGLASRKHAHGFAGLACLSSQALQVTQILFSHWRHIRAGVFTIGQQFSAQEQCDVREHPTDLSRFVRDLRRQNERQETCILSHLCSCIQRDLVAPDHEGVSSCQPRVVRNGVAKQNKKHMFYATCTCTCSLMSGAEAQPFPSVKHFSHTCWNTI